MCTTSQWFFMSLTVSPSFQPFPQITTPTWWRWTETWRSLRTKPWSWGATSPKSSSVPGTQWATCWHLGESSSLPVPSPRGRRSSSFHSQETIAGDTSGLQRQRLKATPCCFFDLEMLEFPNHFYGSVRPAGGAVSTARAPFFPLQFNES